MPQLFMNLNKSAQVIWKDCLAITDKEVVGIVVDDHSLKIGQALHDQAKLLAAESVLIQMSARENHGMEPPQAVASAMAACQALVLATTFSLSHTAARKKANRLGTRVASMPGITAEMLVRALVKGDLEEIHELGAFYKGKIDRGHEVRVVSPGGTDLTFSIEGRLAYNDDGRLDEWGAFGNLPAGEAYVAPVEGTAQGRLVIDASMAAIGLVEAPIKFVVEDGLVTSVAPGPHQKTLIDIFDRYGSGSRNIAELGLGTNPSAKITGQTLEDEKAWGSIHIALGDNATIGGVVVADSHLDGIILKASVYVDGECILCQGIPQIS